MLEKYFDISDYTNKPYDPFYSVLDNYDSYFLDKNKNITKINDFRIITLSFLDISEEELLDKIIDIFYQRSIYKDNIKTIFKDQKINLILCNPNDKISNYTVLSDGKIKFLITEKISKGILYAYNNKCISIIKKENKYNFLLSFNAPNKSNIANLYSALLV